MKDFSAIQGTLVNCDLNKLIELVNAALLANTPASDISKGVQSITLRAKCLSNYRKVNHN